MSGAVPGAHQVARAVAVVLLAGCAAGDAPPQRASYAPAPELERLQYRGEPVAGVGMPVDFEIVGNRLFVLESDRVVVLLHGAGGWSPEREFGRRGEGPGEFRGAAGIGRAGDGVVVAEEKRLQFFTVQGALQATKLLELPCAVRRPAAAGTPAGVYIHGTCHRLGYATDTVKSVLAFSADTMAFDVVLEDVQYTRDGSVGSAFGARYALTVGAADVHAFGAGTTNCVWRIREVAGRPTAEQQCPATDVLYRADPPPGLEERLRARRTRGDNIGWPETLPPYVERFVSGEHLVLVRPISADSIVLQLAGGGGAELAVAPLDGFVGCKAAGCLWLFDELPQPRVLLLDAASTARLIAARPSASPSAR
jgi:hypothetical protein